MIISGSVTNERSRRAPRPLLLFVLLFVLLLFVLPRLMASSPLALLTLGSKKGSNGPAGSCSGKLHSERGMGSM